MTLNFSDKVSYSIISDIAATQIDDLCIEGGLSMSALYDLLEFAQIAVFSDEVLVSPAAYENANWLKSFDCVKPLELDVRVIEPGEGQPESEHELAEDVEDKETIWIDVNEEGYFNSSHPLGELGLALLSFLLLRQAPIIGDVANPFARKNFPTPDYRLRQLPKLMLLTQAATSVLLFEEDVPEIVDPFNTATSDYSQFVYSMDRLSQLWGIETLTSVLEQPLYSNLQVNQRTEFVEDQEFEKEIKKHISTAAINVPGRKEFFEYWNIPPIGFVVLSDAKSLDDVPRAVNRNRDRFKTLRESISSIRQQRTALIGEVDFNTLAGNQAHQELKELDNMMKRSLAEFDSKLASKRAGNRTEMIFNIFDFVIQLAGGLGFSMLGYLVDKLGLKQRALIQKIPGLMRAASTIKNTDNMLTVEWLDKMIPDIKARRSQKVLLDWAFEHGQTYCLTSPHQQPPELLAIKLEDTEITDRKIWITLFRAEEVLDGFINGNFFQ